MPYKYCENSKCPGNGLVKPTIREDLLEGGQICPVCDTVQSQHMTVEEWLVELYESVEEFVNNREFTGLYKGLLD